ncbi:metal-dependent hydrolase [Peptostreptococcus stomatis]|uniref:metal-dependent hydrolase n=1 Tax=Peptostreptococcus stomatis TaxID=341694 RepID=UPI0026ECC100|nr:metal-dependent hydrolase [Peptostreptococcus stomatis]
MRSRTHLIAGTLATLEISILCGLTINPLTIPVAMVCSVMSDIDEANSNVLNKFISKDTTKNIHSLLLFLFAIVSFYMYFKTGLNLYIATIFALAMTLLVSRWLTSNLVRSLVISAVFFLIGASMYLHDFNMGYTLFTLMIATYPLLKHRGTSHSLLALLLTFIVFTSIERGGGPSGLAYPALIAYSSHLVLDMATKRGVPLFLPFSEKYYKYANLKVGSLVCNIVETILILVLAVLLVVILTNMF